MKYVKIIVQSAKLPFVNNKKFIAKQPPIISDITDINNGEDQRVRQIDDVESEYYVKKDSLFVFSPISNMLHVLLGTRPSSRNRKVFTKRSEYIDNIARNGFMKVLNKYHFYDDSKDMDYFYNEMTQGKKARYNSHKTDAFTYVGDGEYVSGYVTWSLLKRKYSHNSKMEQYNLLRDTIIKLNNGDSGLELGVACRNIGKNEESFLYFEKFLSENKIKEGPLLKMCNGESALSFNANSTSISPAALTIDKYPLRMLCFDVEFIFPMEDEDYNNLIHGKRCAKYLDGGFAKYDGTLSFFNEEDLLENDFIKIKNLQS